MLSRAYRPGFSVPLVRFPPAFAAVALLAALAVAACGDDDDGGIGGTLILATTTSTNDSGLLEILEPLFEEETGTDLKVIAVGTGAALEMARNGEADAVLVHAPAAEQEYVESGDLIDGRLVMHNDFVLVGPPDDPTGAGGAAGLDDALRAIARDGTFVSRGDDSGTNKKELQLWADAGVDLDAIDREETGQGMGATLNITSEKGGYTLTDRATYLALEAALALVILVEGDPRLLNVYHVHAVNPERHGGVNAEAARAFLDFLVRDDVLDKIGEFGVEEFGEPLFFPDAGKDAAALGLG